jgi:hypothetical protein
MSDGGQRNGEGSSGHGGLRLRFQDRLTAAQNLLIRLKLRAFNLKQERDFRRFLHLSALCSFYTFLNDNTKRKKRKQKSQETEESSGAAQTRNI